MNKKDTKAWLEKYGVNNYTINKDNTVDVNGHVDLSQSELTKIPIQFGVVIGNFNCGGNDLSDFEGFPKNVGGNFNCRTNKFRSLTGAPSVDGDFICYNNLIDSQDILMGQIRYGARFFPA